MNRKTWIKKVSKPPHISPTMKDSVAEIIDCVKHSKDECRNISLVNKTLGVPYIIVPSYYCGIVVRRPYRPVPQLTRPVQLRY